VAPDFNLKDVNGGGVKIGDLKDKVILANFWAHSVKAARWRFPWVVEFQKEHEDWGLVVIGVSVDDDGGKS